MLLPGAKGTTKSQLLDFFEAKDEETFNIGIGFKHLIRKLDGINNEKELGCVRRARDPTAGCPTLKTANRLYLDKSFDISNDFSKTVRDNFLEANYNAYPEKLDFSTKAEDSREFINNWVKETTEGKISNLVTKGAIDENTKMVLVNAVYLNADWKNKFNPSLTKKQKFTTKEKLDIDVPMMNKIGLFGLTPELEELDGARMLSIPYKGETLDMLIILPGENSNLDKCEKKLKEVGHDMAWTCNKLNVTEVDVSIPTCKIESMIEFNEPLKKVGCPNLVDEKKCDLSGISKKEDLSVSLVVQKATIEINEDGTEASAGTGLLVGVPTSAVFPPPPPPPEFKCNRPFHYMIRERSSGLTLFSGRVENPNDRLIDANSRSFGIGVGAGIKIGAFGRGSGGGGIGVGFGASLNLFGK